MRGAHVEGHDSQEVDGRVDGEYEATGATHVVGELGVQPQRVLEGKGEHCHPLEQ